MREQHGVPAPRRASLVAAFWVRVRAAPASLCALDQTLEKRGQFGAALRARAVVILASMWWGTWTGPHCSSAPETEREITRFRANAGASRGKRPNDGSCCVMTSARIGDRELGPDFTKQSNGLSRTARFSAVIASTIAVLTLFPLLVASVCLFLTMVGQRSLRDSNMTMAGERIDEETTLLARGIGTALEQADPVMDRLALLARDHDPLKPFDRVAHSLRDLIQGRLGVSYISISFPDGTF